MINRTGQATVLTPGTPVAVGTEVINCPMIIEAFPTNSGYIYVGQSTVNSARGFILAAGTMVGIYDVGDSRTIYIDADYGNEGVSWIVGEF